MTISEHAGYVIDRAREKAKANGDPLDNKHIAEYVRIEMDEYESKKQLGGNYKKSVLFSSDYQNFLVELAVPGLMAIILGFFSWIIFCVTIGHFISDEDGLAMYALAFGVVVGVLTLIRQLESMVIEYRNSAHKMEWPGS